MIIIVTCQWWLAEGFAMQHCRYPFYPAQNGSFTAVAVKIQLSNGR